MKNHTFGFVRYVEKKRSVKKQLSKAFLYVFSLRGKILSISLSIIAFIPPFVSFYLSYTQKKVLTYSLLFEKHKNILVRFFMMKRGRYNRLFLHVAAMSVVIIGIMAAPFLANTYPIFSKDQTQVSLALIESEKQSISVDGDVFKTEISQKPRDKVITYRVQKGDTLTTIAQKFGISQNTIKWANDLTSDDLTVDDELKILPVTGLTHKVAKGDTVYTIAKKYDTDPQAIVDFPFNDFANPQTFSLVVGQMLVVPDGVKPSEIPSAPRRQVYIVQGPATISAAGFTWPLRGVISQFAAWYHMAIDITSPIGTPVVAGQNGTVVKALAGTWDGGYGTNLMIDNGGGFQSLYAHLSSLNVSVGDTVVAGKTVIGYVGMSGRTTGPHVHFEVYRNGVLVNPLAFLQ